MKRRSFLAALPLAASATLAKSKAIAAARMIEDMKPEPNLPRLKFRPDGKFKILVISDTH